MKHYIIEIISIFSAWCCIQSKEFYSEERILPKKPVYYRTREECDVWFSPEIVWEIRGAGDSYSRTPQDNLLNNIVKMGDGVIFELLM